MVNIKWSGIAGGCAFILSLLIGLSSGAGSFALVRALIFGAGFFALVSGIYWLISQFLSELLDDSSQEVEESGSQVNIMVEGDDELPAGGVFQSPQEAAGQGSQGDVSAPAPDDVLGMALDQGREDGYTNKENVEGSTDSGGVSGPGALSEAAIPTAGEDAVDMLPDLEGISAYQSLTVEDTMDVSTAPPSLSKKPSMNSARPMELDGDFKPKEIASAIQTLLKKE